MSQRTIEELSIQKWGTRSYWFFQKLTHMPVHPLSVAAVVMHWIAQSESPVEVGEGEVEAEVSADVVRTVSKRS